MSELTEILVDMFKESKPILFIGSGLSTTAGIPSASTLARHLAGLMSSDLRGDTSLSNVAMQVEQKFGRSRLIKEVRHILASTKADEISTTHHLVATLIKHNFCRTIITTNYDTLIEEACAAHGVQLNIVAEKSHIHLVSNYDPALIKLHGDFDHPQHLVMTQQDYDTWESQPNTKALLTYIQSLFLTQPMLFLGYSLSDTNVLNLLLATKDEDIPQPLRLALVYESNNFDEIEKEFAHYNVRAFLERDAEQLLRTVLIELPIQLNVEHLLLNYSYDYDPEALYGGIETFISYMKRSHRANHRVTHVYQSDMVSSTGLVYPSSYYFFRAATTNALEQLRAEKTAGRHKPDIVHVHFLALAGLVEDDGFPTLCTSHSYFTKDIAFARGVFDHAYTKHTIEELQALDLAEREAAINTTFVTALTQYHADEIQKLGCAQVRLMPELFDANEFLGDVSPGQQRHDLNMDDVFTITYVGRPDRRKGIEVLIQACKNLARKRKRFQLILVGSGFRMPSKANPHTISFGTQESAYSGRALFSVSSSYAANSAFSIDVRELQRRRIKIAHYSAQRGGYKSRIAQLYAASDVVVVPSLYEPMGYVVLEAMASGRAIVASRTGGIVELVKDGETALLFEPGDADDLTRALLKLMKERALARSLGSEARKSVVQRPSLAQSLSEWDKLYREIAFSFGDPHYSFPPEIESVLRDRLMARLSSIQHKLSPFSAAMVGCDVAKEMMNQYSELKPKEDLPFNANLLRSIARIANVYLRSQAISSRVSSRAMFELMKDITLAYLNRDDGVKSGITLDAKTTLKEIQQTNWLNDALRR